MRSESVMKMRKRNRHPAAERRTALLLCAVLLCMLLGGCGGGTDTEAGIQEDAPDAGTATVAESSTAEQTEDHTPATGPSLAAEFLDPQAVRTAVPAEKKETVTVRADASGRPYEKTVEAELSRPAGEAEAAGYLRDRTDLYAITNTEGDEEFVREDDSTILWKDSGEILRYEGKSDAQLPVEVQVRYYLDGEEKSPAEMDGAEGEVRIRFVYRNRTEVQTEVDGREYYVPVPFTVISAVLLDGDVFSEIEAENGKVTEIGGQTAVIGYAFPGLEDALELGNYEPTEEVEIPSFVEIRARTSGFKLDFTATVITPGLFGELEEDDLRDAQDLPKDMEELADASAELADAASDLYDGAGTFGSYLRKYVRAASRIGDGIDGMKEGLETLDENGAQLREGAQGLQEALGALDRMLSQMDLSSLDPQDAESAAAIKALQEAAAALEQDGKALLEEHLPALEEQVRDLTQFTEDATAYKEAVDQGIALTEEALTELEAFDTEAFEQELTQKARDQAGEAARQAQETAQAERAEEIRKTAEQTAGSAAASAAETAGLDAEQQAALEAVLETELKEHLAGLQESGSVEEQVRAAVDLTGSAEALAQLHADTVQKIREAWEQDVIRGYTVPETSIDGTELLACLDDMARQIQILDSFASGMGGTAQQLEGLKAALQSLQTYARQLSEGSTALSEGLSAYGEGVSALADGAQQLSGGIREFSKAGSQLAGGYGAVTEGLKAFSEGMDTFDRDAIQKLGDLAGEDLAELLRRLRAVRAADNSYTNFSGILPEQQGSVRFVLETDGIGE